MFYRIFSCSLQDLYPSFILFDFSFSFFKYLIILFLSNICVPKFDLDSEFARRNYVLPTVTHKILACHVGMWRTIYSLDLYLQNCWVFQISKSTAPKIWNTQQFTGIGLENRLPFNMDLVVSCMPNPRTSDVSASLTVCF